MINYFITKHENCKKCYGIGSIIKLNQPSQLCTKCLGEGIEVSQVNLVDILKENLEIRLVNDKFCEYNQIEVHTLFQNQQIFYSVIHIK